MPQPEVNGEENHPKRDQHCLVAAADLTVEEKTVEKEEKKPDKGGLAGAKSEQAEPCGGKKKKGADSAGFAFARAKNQNPTGGREKESQAIGAS